MPQPQSLRSLPVVALSTLIFAHVWAQEGNPAPSGPPLAPPQAKLELPFTLHGGIYLWHYEPFLDGVKSQTEIYNVYFLLDVPLDDFRFHFEPRIRQDKFRPFFASNTWIQEAYIEWKPEELSGDALKAGKIYNQFGRFWDGSFFGNVQYLDGVKLDPDIGLSYEGKGKMASDLDTEYSLQYFATDGSTNGSLQDRDTLSIIGAEQRSSFVGRVAPTWHATDSIDLGFGVSGQSFEADFAPGIEDDRVNRYALDVNARVGAWSAFGEYIHQDGQSVLDFPYAGIAASDIGYYWAGIEYKVGRWRLRYNYSVGDYKDVDVRETIHQPGIIFDANEHVRIYLEYDYWDRDASTDGAVQDRSLNLVLNLNF